MYSVCLLIIAVVIFRMVSTGEPGELKNYIIKSDKIEKAYKELKENFKMYQIKIRDTFAMGDALFVDNIYYLESAENMQLTLRFKNSRLEEMFGYSPDGDNAISSRPSFFRYYLKVSSVNPNAGDIESSNYILDYVILETVNENSFGKDTDRYSYYVLSFDDVKIEYATTKVELYVVKNNIVGETVFDEDDYSARFTLFDVNMPKTKVQAKKFDLGG